MILTKAAAVLKKDFLTALRYRNGFIFNFVSPALQLVTFYYLARAVGPQFRPDGMSYVTFLIVGTGFYTFLIAGIHGFFQTIQQAQQTGTLELLMTTSTPPSVLLFLSALSSFGGSFVQFALYVGGGILLFAPHVRVNVFGSLLVLVLSLGIAAALGLFAASLQISIHKGSAVLWLLGACAWLMAGTLFPVSALPKSLQVLSALLPFTHSLTAMRFAIFDGRNWAALAREIGCLAVFCGALLPAGICFFAWTLRRARQYGQLAFY